MKPIIALRLSPVSYSGLVDLGNRVVASLAGNISFTTPAVTLMSLQTAITNVVDAIALWGPKGNHGSHADLVNLRQKALVLRQLLQSEAKYVEITAQLAAGTDFVTMTTIIVSSGYQLSNAATPQGILQMVQNFHRFDTRKVNPNQVKLKWKRPLNTLPNNVKSYRVLRGTSTVFSSAVEIGVTTKASFVDTNSSTAPITWSYWIVPVNTNGGGIVSDAVTVTLPGM